MIFYKGAKITQWGKDIIFSTNSAGTAEYPHAKEWTETPTSPCPSCTQSKINSKWITNWNVSGKTIKLLEENTEEKLHNPGLGKEFLNIALIHRRRKSIDWTLSKLKTFTLQKIPLRYRFTIAMRWKQLKYPLTDDWVNKMCIHTVEHYSALKRKEILTHATAWMSQDIMLSEKASHNKTNTIWFHLSEVPRMVKLRDSRMVFPGAGGREKGGVTI